jgi:hypothetical protein
MEYNKTEVINRTERANSFSGRYSGVGSEFKCYWDTLDELKAGIDAVIKGKNYLAEQLSAVTFGGEDK